MAAHRAPPPPDSCSAATLLELALLDLSAVRYDAVPAIPRSACNHIAPPPPPVAHASAGRSAPTPPPPPTNAHRVVHPRWLVSAPLACNVRIHNCPLTVPFLR